MEKHHHHEGEEQPKPDEYSGIPPQQGDMQEHDHDYDHNKTNDESHTQIDLHQVHVHSRMHHNMPAEPGAYDEHAGHHTADFLKRFWISLALTIPVLLLSKMVQHWAGFDLSFPGDQYILFALGTIIFFYGGWPFLTGLVNELKHRNPGMMTLVAVAITTAYLYSSAVVFGLKGMDFSGNWPH